jgi:hypothetical protein
MMRVMLCMWGVTRRTMAVLAHLRLRSVNKRLCCSVNFLDEDDHLVLRDDLVLVAVGSVERLGELVAGDEAGYSSGPDNEMMRNQTGFWY